MPKEFPKALYTGDQTNYEMIPVQNSEEEHELREQGAVDFVDLPEREAGVEPKSMGGDPILEGTLVPVEQFDTVTEKLGEAEAEIERLNSVITAGIAENAELRKTIRLKELEDTQADELKKMLDDAGVTYQARDGKHVLAKLLLDHVTANQN